MLTFSTQIPIEINNFVYKKINRINNDTRYYNPLFNIVVMNENKFSKNHETIQESQSLYVNGRGMSIDGSDIYRYITYLIANINKQVDDKQQINITNLNNYILQYKKNDDNIPNNLNEQIVNNKFDIDKPYNISNNKTYFRYVNISQYECVPNQLTNYNFDSKIDLNFETNINFFEYIELTYDNNIDTSYIDYMNHIYDIVYTLYINSSYNKIYIKTCVGNIVSGGNFNKNLCNIHSIYLFFINNLYTYDLNNKHNENIDNLICGSSTDFSIYQKSNLITINLQHEDFKHIYNNIKKMNEQIEKNIYDLELSIICKTGYNMFQYLHSYFTTMIKGIHNNYG